MKNNNPSMGVTPQKPAKPLTKSFFNKKSSVVAKGMAKLQALRTNK